MIELDIIKKKMERPLGLSSSFGKYSKIYLETTENIRELMEKEDFQNKDVISVAGSGDQAINSYLFGAKNVTCFDVNPLAFAQSDLKFNCAKNLDIDFSTFLSFFDIYSTKFLSPYIYEQFRKTLQSDTKTFFDYIISNYKACDILLKVYYGYFQKLEKKQRLNAILEESNFYKFKELACDKNISYIESDIANLKQLIDNVDIILLSNISESADKIFLQDPEKSYLRLIHSLSKKLNKKGFIEAAYIYDYFYRSTRNKTFNSETLNNGVLTKKEFEEILVSGYQSYSSTDGILLYRKK